MRLAGPRASPALLGRDCAFNHPWGASCVGGTLRDVPQQSPAPALRPARGAAPDPEATLAALLLGPGRRTRLTHVEHVPARPGAVADWPAWAHAELVAALVRSGVHRPWLHQVQAAELARAGRSVVLSTGTASGKSLAYLLPALTASLEGAGGSALAGPPTTLYL